MTERAFSTPEHTSEHFLDVDFSEMTAEMIDTSNTELYGRVTEGLLDGTSPHRYFSLVMRNPHEQPIRVTLPTNADGTVAVQHGAADCYIAYNLNRAASEIESINIISDEEEFLENYYSIMPKATA